jgi:hypothetical protein
MLFLLVGVAWVRRLLLVVPLAHGLVLECCTKRVLVLCRSGCELKGESNTSFVPLFGGFCEAKLLARPNPFCCTYMAGTNLCEKITAFPVIVVVTPDTRWRACNRQLEAHASGRRAFSPIAWLRHKSTLNIPLLPVSCSFRTLLCSEPLDDTR